MIRVEELLTCGCAHKVSVRNIVYQTEDLNDLRNLNIPLNLSKIKGSLSYNILSDMDILSSKIDSLSNRLDQYTERYNFLTNSIKNSVKSNFLIDNLNKNLNDLINLNFSDKYYSILERVNDISVKKYSIEDIELIDFLTSFNSKKVSYKESNYFFADDDGTFITLKLPENCSYILCSTSDNYNNIQYNIIEGSSCLKIYIDVDSSEALKYNYKIQVLILE